MKNLIVWILFAVFTISCYSCKNSPTKNTEKQIDAPKKSTPFGKDEKESVLKIVDSKELSDLFSNYSHIEKYLRLMDNDKERLVYLEELRRRPNLLMESLDVYNKLTEMSNEDNHYIFSEARWRIVHLMGDIKDPKVGEQLYDIALSQLPNPEKVKESTFKSEFRIRLRAIAGLEKSKGIEFLEKIYKQDELLGGAAAASLYELGAAPKGVTKMDEKEVIGSGNPKDFKVNPENVIRKGYERIPQIEYETDSTKTIIPGSKNIKNEN